MVALPVKAARRRLGVAAVFAIGTVLVMLRLGFKVVDALIVAI
ncbi:hypothetical protein [Bradyrhizobium sp. AZCC 2289]